MHEKIENILLSVQKPGRYTGGELNSVQKPLDQVDVRFAFCFPDVYEVGMSHLGLSILYYLFNQMEGVWCERVFAPWADMEEKLREHGLPLYALESGDPVSEFDILGFTLQYELSYSNLLNILALSGVPLLASERQGLSQLVIAGGPCACNPEPLADFVDLFVLGEGEEVGVELVELYRTCKKEGADKETFLRRAAQVEGVYVPSLYEVSYRDDGTIEAVAPREDAPEKIRKRIVRDMDTAFYPDRLLVPYLEIVHDRSVSEIFRGCIRGCRFCQAGFLCRPVREKSIETIQKQCSDLCGSTGYEEVSLSSLSSSDYSDITGLLTALSDWSEREMVSLSLPSLRIDGFSNEIMQKLNIVRRAGLTFAPEAGTQRLRDVINKNITEEDILSTCRKAFRGGWTKVKLYFMIGLPTETMEDVAGIPALGQAVVNAYYQNPNKPKGKSVGVTVSASCFVPKPFTPFQWEAQDTLEQFEGKQKHLLQNLTTRKIKLNYHDASTSFLEGVFARGDRRLGAVLLEAHKRGCRFDGWSDFFRYDTWMDAFNACGIDPVFYANRKRAFSEVLPWDHLDYGVTKAFLQTECEQAYAARTTQNCREACSACGAAVWGEGICVEAR